MAGKITALHVKACVLEVEKMLLGKEGREESRKKESIKVISNTEKQKRLQIVCNIPIGHIDS